MSMVLTLAKCFEELASTLEKTGLKIGGNFFNYLKNNMKTIRKNGVDIVVINLQPINLSLVAPSGAGKTTLLSTVMKDITGVLPKGFDAYPQSDDDAFRIAKYNEALSAAIAGNSVKIETRVLEGSTISKKYTFEIAYEDLQKKISVCQPFVLMDIPGTLLDREIRKTVKGDWLDFIEHLRQSLILWIPIEAPLLMEASIDREKSIASKLMKRNAIEEVIHEWAKYRVEEKDAPGCVCFAPVKCETYFSQDATHKKADVFFNRFTQNYKTVLSKIRETYPSCKIHYAPVESIGCIKLSSATWTDDELKADYRIIRPRGRRIAGAEAFTCTIYQYGSEQIVKTFGATLDQMEKTFNSQNIFGIISGNITGSRKQKEELLIAIKNIVKYLDTISQELLHISNRAYYYKYFKEL
jgi:hypothetical protein